MWIPDLGEQKEKQSCRHTIVQTPDCKQCFPVPLWLGKSDQNCELPDELTGLVWLYKKKPDIFLLVDESLKVEKSNLDPKAEMPRSPICEERLTTRDLCSGVEALYSARTSNSVK